MSQKPEKIADADLQFFGQISASISHELKNVLAIINENAGLLEDLSLMADRGAPLDLARLQAMATGVKKQVDRANTIIGNMNRFAHSADQSAATVDMAQSLELVMAVSARLAAMQGVEISLQAPGHPVTLETDPYRLIHIIWRCLEYSMAAVGEDKQVELVVEDNAGSVRIRIGRLARLNDAPLPAFPSDREKKLLEKLDADLAVDPAGNEIRIEMTKNEATN